MKRFLYVTDRHYKFAKPINRKDDYGEAILGKSRQVNQLVIDRGVHLVGDGGDLLDRSTQTPQEILKMFAVLRECPVPTVAVIGNHPMKGNWEDYKHRSGYNVLDHMLGDKWKTLDPYAANFEVEGLTLRMDHSDIVREPVKWDHVLFDDYDAAGADVVLVSHYHPKQGTYERKDGVVFVSPGALSRGSLGEDNVNRIPSVAILDIHKGKLKGIEYVELDVAPAAEVLDLSVEIKRKKNNQFGEVPDEIIGELRSLTTLNVKTQSADQLINEYAKVRGLAPMALRLILELLKEAEEK